MCRLSLREDGSARTHRAARALVKSGCFLGAEKQGLSPSTLHELLLPLAHDQYGTRRVPHHPLRRAAQPEVLVSRVAVVSDKFPVVIDANQAAAQVRWAGLRLRGPSAWEASNESRWLWRRNPENFTEKESARLAGMDQKSPPTAKAHPMRLVRQGI